MNNSLIARIASRLLVLALAFGFYSNGADEEVPDHKLSEWKLGKTLLGDTYTQEDLEGKVVVIEYWGVRCGPCIAAMPHLAELDQRNRKKGLRIIGSEAQKSALEDIKKLTDEHNVEYTITQGASGPVSGNGIPHALVFDSAGQLIYNGHPAADEFERTIKKALRDVKKEEEKTSLQPTGPLVAERSWTNSEGKSIVAAAMAVEGEKVSFKMKNGRLVAYPLEQLSADDQALLKEAASEVSASK